MTATNNRIWVINKDQNDFTKVEQDLGRLVVLKPNRPYSLPRNIALRYVQKYKTIELCNNPKEYLSGQPLEKLIIRDAGIGDLLLLEPVLRQLAKNKNGVSIMTRFPEVYENNPHIKKIIRMEHKGDIPSGIDVNTEWDTYDDLRSYSETCPDRDVIHRTECYNQIFELNIENKEPRLYFNKKETSLLKKEKGCNYIGIACDGSHFFRRYSEGDNLIKTILKNNKKNRIVILGDGWEDGRGFIKYKDHDKRVLDLQGKTNIRQVINVIRDLDYMVVVDTGLMHIALTLHVPTVCIFSIIAPDLRIKYYTGKRQIIYRDEMDCIGCGSWHMAKCKYGDIRFDPAFIPPCLKIKPEAIMCALLELDKEDDIKIYETEHKIEPVKKKIMINKYKGRKLIMPIIVLNEEKNLPRFVELVMKNPNIEKTIAIDGGSNDRTVEILKKAGAFVYVHNYDKDYHDMQAMQRNISCSFVKDGEKIIIMDIDECFSDGLNEYLPELIESNIDYALLSRRTFDYFDDINDPVKQIKDYPDWQPRFFTWHKEYKWIGSPHHNIYNTPDPIKIKKDIIHFEKENKNRDALERQWSKMHAKTKEIYL